MTDPSDIYSQNKKRAVYRSPKELDDKILSAAHKSAEKKSSSGDQGGWSWAPYAATTALFLVGLTFIFNLNPFMLDSKKQEFFSSESDVQNESAPETDALAVTRTGNVGDEEAAFVMEEIVVTGRKREEADTDIPVSRPTLGSALPADVGSFDENQIASRQEVFSFDDVLEPENENTSDLALADVADVAKIATDDNQENRYALAEGIGAATSAPTVQSRSAAMTSSAPPLSAETNSTLIEAGSMNLELVNVAELIPSLILDIRYATSNNFVGEPIDGYLSAKALLTPEATNALTRVQESLLSEGLTLKIFDAYRPQRGVDHFIRWSQDESTQTTKQKYYPNMDKSELFSLGYLTERSSHSRGSTVDLTIAKINDDGTHEELDMGTVFDFFDPSSWPSSQEVSEEAQRNRNTLRDLMEENGFIPFTTEWWHFTLADEPFPNQYFDLSID